MKNPENTIFIDLAVTLFPKRLSLMPELRKELLSKWEFENYINHTNADIVAANLLNSLNAKNEFNLVLLDNWIDLEKHKKEFFEELLMINGLKSKLHNNWLLGNDNKMQSPLGPITQWMKINQVNNYAVILNEKYKYELDFNVESSVNFNYSVFANEENGLLFKNIQELTKSFSLWN